MKKLLFAFTLMLMPLMASAQSIEGTWVMEGGFSEAFSQLAENEKMKLDMGLSFTQTDVKLLVWFTAGEDGTLMKMVITIPGTYKKEGDVVNCTFDNKKIDFEITDIESEDEEMKAMTADPASKQMVLMMIKGAVKKEFAPYLEQMGMMSGAFETFTVKSVTDTELTIGQNEKSIVFKKKE